MGAPNRLLTQAELGCRWCSGKEEACFSDLVNLGIGKIDFGVRQIWFVSELHHLLTAKPHL